MAPLDLLLPEHPRTDSRKNFNRYPLPPPPQTLHFSPTWYRQISQNPYSHSGYVALAVVSEKGSLRRDLSTGLGGDRSGNMVAFAVAALKLVEEFILSGEAKIEKI